MKLPAGSSNVAIDKYVVANTADMRKTLLQTDSMVTTTIRWAASGPSDPGETKCESTLRQQVHRNTYWLKPSAGKSPVTVPVFRRDGCPSLAERGSCTPNGCLPMDTLIMWFDATQIAGPAPLHTAYRQTSQPHPTTLSKDDDSI